MLIVEDYSSVDKNEMHAKSPIVVSSVSEDQDSLEESNEEVLEILERNVQQDIDTVSQCEEEDDEVKTSGAESGEKHDVTVSNEAGKPAEDECEKNNRCEEGTISEESALPS